LEDYILQRLNVPKSWKPKSYKVSSVITTAEVWSKFSITQWKFISARFKNTATYLGLFTDKEAEDLVKDQKKSKDETIDFLFVKLLSKALDQADRTSPI